MFIRFLHLTFDGSTVGNDGIDKWNFHSAEYKPLEVMYF